MTDRPDQNENDSEEFSFDRSELDAMRTETAAFMRQRLVMWAIRWTIGFALIAVVVWYSPDLKWLWWVGLGIALVSLAILLIGQRAITNKFDQTDTKITEADAEIRALEAEDATERSRQDD